MLQCGEGSLRPLGGANGAGEGSASRDRRGPRRWSASWSWPARSNLDREEFFRKGGCRPTWMANRVTLRGRDRWRGSSSGCFAHPPRAPDADPVAGAIWHGYRSRPSQCGHTGRSPSPKAPHPEIVEDGTSRGSSSTAGTRWRPSRQKASIAHRSSRLSPAGAAERFGIQNVAAQYEAAYRAVIGFDRARFRWRLACVSPSQTHGDRRRPRMTG